MHGQQESITVSESTYRKTLIGSTDKVFEDVRPGKTHPPLHILLLIQEKFRVLAFSLIKSEKNGTKSYCFVQKDMI